MNGRDKRRRVKARKNKETMDDGRQQVSNPAGVTVLPKANAPTYGKYCRVRKAKVDISVCTVQSARTPDLCKGC